MDVVVSTASSVEGSMPEDVCDNSINSWHFYKKLSLHSFFFIYFSYICKKQLKITRYEKTISINYHPLIRIQR